MKKLLVIITLLIIFAVALADPGDVYITFRIPADKVEEFRAGFLAMCPVPPIEDPDYILDPNDPNDFIPDIPKYTDKQWIKEWVIREVKRAYRLGKIKLGSEAAISDPNIIIE